MSINDLQIAATLSAGAIVYQFFYFNVINNLFTPVKAVKYWLLEWCFLSISFFFIITSIGLVDNFIFTILMYFIAGCVVFAPHFIINPFFDIKNASKTDILKFELSNYISSPVRIFVYDNHKVNAYATGVIRNHQSILIHRDLLYGSQDLLRSIVFHELGHLKNNHLLRLYMLSAFSYMMSMLLVFFSNKTFFPFFDSLGEVNTINIIVVGATIGLTQFYLPRIFQKKMEHEADLFAANIVGVDSYEKALFDLDKLSNGRVSKGAVTHPNLEDRIKYLRKIL